MLVSRSTVDFRSWRRSGFPAGKLSWNGMERGRQHEGRKHLSGSSCVTSTSSTYHITSSNPKHTNVLERNAQKSSQHDSLSNHLVNKGSLSADEFSYFRAMKSSSGAEQRDGEYKALTAQRKGFAGPCLLLLLLTLSSYKKLLVLYRFSILSINSHCGSQRKTTKKSNPNSRFRLDSVSKKKKKDKIKPDLLTRTSPNIFKTGTISWETGLRNQPRENNVKAVFLAHRQPAVH